MEGMGDSYSEFIQRAEESSSSPSCSSIFKQKKIIKASDNNRQSCSTSMPSHQGNRHGIPHSHHPPLGPGLQSPYAQSPFSNCNSSTQRPSHSRSLSQPAFLSLDQSSSMSSVPEAQLFDRLPPISPASMHLSKRRNGMSVGATVASSDISGGSSLDASMDNQNPLGASNRSGIAISTAAHCPLPPSSFGSSGSGLPARQGHRRVHSEVPYQFSQQLQSSFGPINDFLTSGTLKDGAGRERIRDQPFEGQVSRDCKGGFNMDDDLNMECLKESGELGNNLYNVPVEMQNRDNVKNSEGGVIGPVNDESRKQIMDANDKACKGLETRAEKSLKVVDAESKERTHNIYGSNISENECQDIVMRTADGSDGIHIRTDSGGSDMMKEKNDKDADWSSSGDEADSEINLIGNQNRNALLLERDKEGNGHQSFGSTRHNRSMSVDSILTNTNSINSAKDLKLSPSQSQSSRDFHRSSTDVNINFKMELGNGEFTEAELKKILSNEKLTEIARTDPRRVKRILANRLSAARSKERKMLYISELEGKVQTLQTEATTLSAQLTLMQRDLSGLANENNGLKLRLQAMEQQAQLQDALNKALMEEVQRLKLATGQPIAEQSSGLVQQISLSSHLYQLQQHGLQQQQQVEDNVQSSGQKISQNGTFQNSNNAYQQFMGSV